MKLFRKWLILSHRYLGLLIALLVVMWFASGIVMMYAGGMPRLTPQLRRERMANLDLASIRITPAQAAETAAIPLSEPGGAGRRRRGGSSRAVLLSVLDRPAYRFSGDFTVFADTGKLMDELTVEQASTVAQKFTGVPANRVSYAGTLTKVDQWTLNQARQMPLYKFTVDDGQGTELFVQAATGEIVMLTNSRSRMMAWLGTIPHWLYFSALRTHAAAWYQIVVWTSALACVVTILGIALGFTQFRRPNKFRLAAAIPYSGLMRWHYITGAAFGLFSLTWAFSGLLSMEPFEWTRVEGLEVPPETLSGGPVSFSDFAAIDPKSWPAILGNRGIKEIEFAKIQDRNYYIVRPEPSASEAAQRRERLHQPYDVDGPIERDRILVDAATLAVRHEPFSTESLIKRLRAALPDTPTVEEQLLNEYDSYYYSREQERPLPVLRVKFADAAQTWVYIDPEMSQVLAQVHRLNRMERWLYNGLHSLDFSFWYYNRPLWDIGMIVLLLGGLASSAIGLYLGVKRLVAGPKKQVKPLTPQADQGVLAPDSAR